MKLRNLGLEALGMYAHFCSWYRVRLFHEVGLEGRKIKGGIFCKRGKERVEKEGRELPACRSPYLQ